MRVAKSKVTKPCIITRFILNNQDVFWFYFIKNFQAASKVLTLCLLNLYLQSKRNVVLFFLEKLLMIIGNFMRVIESSQNEQLKQLSKLLRYGKNRRQAQLAVLEGVHLLDSYLRENRQPERVFIAQSRVYDEEIKMLLARLSASVCVLVNDEILSSISSFNQDVDVMTLIDVSKLVVPPKLGDCVVLDCVQDPGNLGTVLRSAAAAGIKKIVLGKGCADAYAPKVLRAGMGAHFLLDIVERVDLVDWCDAYQGRILATALGNEKPTSLYDLNLKTENAWLFGNEGNGIQAELLKRANSCIMIPMLGATESLNIAMAATVCLFEQMRQRMVKE